MHYSKKARLRLNMNNHDSINFSLSIKKSALKKILKYSLIGFYIFLVIGFIYEGVRGTTFFWFYHRWIHPIAYMAVVAIFPAVGFFAWKAIIKSFKARTILSIVIGVFFYLRSAAMYLSRPSSNYTTVQGLLKDMFIGSIPTLCLYLGVVGIFTIINYLILRRQHQ